MESLTRTLSLLLVAGTVALTGCATTQGQEQKKINVVYHINEGNDQATDGLRNARNHLKASPNTKIVFVAHSKGINFLLDGAVDKNGSRYDAIVDDLANNHGVEFRLCQVTLDRANIDKSKVIMSAQLVPSGVAEVARLQAEERYTYLKP